MSQEKKTTQQHHIEWLRQLATQHRSSEKRLAYAWEIARKAAQLLRERYGISRVRVFGSLLHPAYFHSKSDIDLAVEGLLIRDYWDALADVLFLDDQLTIDLVDPDTCSPDVWARVEKEGVDV